MVIILAYLFYFIAASASPLQRRWLARRRPTEGLGQVRFAFQVSLLVSLCGLLLPLISPLEIKGNIAYLVLVGCLTGFFGAGYFITAYIAQKHVEAGVSTLISNIYTPIAIVCASIFLNEKLSETQIVGTILLLTAIIIISKKHHLGKFRFDKYFILMVISGLMLGLLLTFERILQKTTGFTTGTLLSWWSQTIFLGLAVLATKSTTLYSKKDTLITGILRFFQSLSWVVLLFVVGNLSLVSAVTTFKVVIIFAAAAILLHEREDLKRKILGSAIAVIGLLLMK